MDMITTGEDLETGQPVVPCVGDRVGPRFLKDGSTLATGPARTAPRPEGFALENPAGRIPQESIPAVLSFDIEEHHRIEAAVGLEVPATLKGDYHQRMCRATGWILEQLAERDITATFFILGEIARESPDLIRSIHEAGHEIASHGWNHSRLHSMTPEAFREDVRKSKDALEQASGAAVVGYRAPTFSLVRKTAWASISCPSSACSTTRRSIRCTTIATASPKHREGRFWRKEPATRSSNFPPRRCASVGMNVPVGGGGYFRMLPLAALEAGSGALAARPAVRAPPCFIFIPGSSTSVSLASR